VSDTELLPKSKPDAVRRVEVFTGAGRRRAWTAEQKAQIVAESWEGGDTVSGVPLRHGLTPQQLFGWRREVRQGAEREAGESGPAFAKVIVEPCRRDRDSSLAPAVAGGSHISARRSRCPPRCDGGVGKHRDTFETIENPDSSRYLPGRLQYPPSAQGTRHERPYPRLKPSPKDCSTPNQQRRRKPRTENSPRTRCLGRLIGPALSGDYPLCTFRGHAVPGGMIVMANRLGRLMPWMALNDLSLARGVPPTAVLIIRRTIAACAPRISACSFS
jgi:transposase